MKKKIKKIRWGRPTVLPDFLVLYWLAIAFVALGERNYLIVNLILLGTISWWVLEFIQLNTKWRFK